MQQDLARKLETFRLANEASAPVRDAANSMWTQIQIIKQGLDILLVDAHPDTEDAVAAVQDASVRLSKIFAEAGPELPQGLRSALHGIKNEAYEIQKLIGDFKNIARYSRDIPANEKARILAIRFGLTKSQNYVVESLQMHNQKVQKQYADLLRPGVEL
jgi:hypothetical protein